MDEIIALLQAKAESVPVPLDLPSEDDLLNVEEALFLQLPKEYRHFLSEVGDIVLGQLEPATAADPQSHTYIPELAAEQWSLGLPRHLIPICVTHNKTYAVDPDGNISVWQGSKALEGEWESIWEWAYQVWLPSAG